MSLCQSIILLVVEVLRAEPSLRISRVELCEVVNPFCEVVNAFRGVVRALCWVGPLRFVVTSEFQVICYAHGILTIMEPIFNSLSLSNLLLDFFSENVINIDC